MGKNDKPIRRGGPSEVHRAKGAIAKRTRKLLWSGKPNPAFKPISLRLPPEKR